MITTENYEAYLLDLLEDNLSVEDKKELLDFLAKHPELESDLPEEHTTLYPQPEKEFPKEQILFDAINNRNYTYFFIAYIEDQLTTSQKTEVEQFIKQFPDKAKEFNEFKATKLKAPAVSFDNKESLFFEKTRIIPLYLKYIARVAAVALLFLITYQFIDFKDNSSQRAVAIIEENPLKNSTPIKQENGPTEGSDKNQSTLFTEKNSTSTTLAQQTIPVTVPSNNLINDRTLSTTKPKDEMVQTPDPKDMTFPKLIQLDLKPIHRISSNLNDLVAHLNLNSINNSKDETLPTIPTPKKEEEILSFRDYAFATAKKNLETRKSILSGFTDEIKAISKQTQVSNNEENGRKKQLIKIGNFSFERTIAKK